MPKLKPISGHTGCTNSRRYLEKDDRALAVDLINLVPELPGVGGWDRQMDRTRAMFGNDRPWKGKRAMTYKHYVLSPDPRDRVDLATLRELATAWTNRYFPDYQVAIVYHDDNELHIPHAHLVVNNTNIATGCRLSSELTKARVREINVGLQQMAFERGLSAFLEDGRESLNADEVARRERAKSIGDALVRPRPQIRMPDRRCDKVQAAIEDSGKVSWKAELQDRVDVARRVARTERQFKAALSALGVELTVSKNGDWLYHHPDGGAKQVRGARLGRAYTRQSLRRGFELGYSTWVRRAGSHTAPPDLTNAQIEAVCAAVERVGSRSVDGGVTAHDVCELLDYNAAHSVTSRADYGRGAEARRMAGLADRIGLFDEVRVTRQTRRLRQDVATVGAWIQQERTESGFGGREAGGGEQTRQDEESRRREKDSNRTPGGSRGQGEREG